MLTRHDAFICQKKAEKKAKEKAKLQKTASRASLASQDDDDTEAGATYIWATRQKTYHYAGSWASFSRPIDWKSPCGFRSGISEFEWIINLPEHATFCKQCIRYHKT